MIRATTSVAVALAAIAAAGCDLVFAPGDHQAPSARLELSSAYVGASVEIVPTPVAAAAPAEYLIEDASQPDGFRHITATVVAPDAWYAQIPAGTAPMVMFAVPDQTYVRIWDLGVTDLVGRATLLRRQEADAAADTAVVGVNVTLQSPFQAGSIFVYGVGPWVTRSFGTPPGGATVVEVAPVSYTSFASVSASTRWRYTTDDRMLVLRYSSTNDLVGSLIVDPLNQSESDTLSGTVTDLVLDQQVTFDIVPSVQNRLALVRPVMANPSMSWTVLASPGLDHGVSAGPQLATRAVAATDPGHITGTYANPFSWPASLRINAVVSRSVIPVGSSLAVTLQAGLFGLAPAVDGTAVPLDGPTPHTITLAGVPLIADNMPVTLERGAPVVISAELLDPEPRADHFTAVIYELVETADGWMRQPRVELMSTKPEWRVPAAVFDGIELGFIRVNAHRGGLLGLPTGDAATMTLPLQIGYLDSGVFVLPPPPT